MNTLVKSAIGIAPGDTLISIMDGIDKETGAVAAGVVEHTVEKVNYTADRVYVSGYWGIFDFAKYARIVIKG